MKAEDFKLVRVDWFDAQSGFASPMDLDELMAVPPIETTSVGCLVHEDKDKIVLGFMMFGNEGYFKHWQMIPKGMVKKITYLRTTNNKSPQKMIKCKGCYYKTNPNNKTGYCYRCKRGKYNKETQKWEGGVK